MIFVHEMFKNILFSGHSCARKMHHLLLAGYEDAPSFLNQCMATQSIHRNIPIYRSTIANRLYLCLASHDIKTADFSSHNVSRAMRF